MSVNVKDNTGRMYECAVCNCISFKQSKKYKFDCSYCKTGYTLTKEMLSNLAIIKHTGGRQTTQGSD